MIVDPYNKFDKGYPWRDKYRAKPSALQVRSDTAIKIYICIYLNIYNIHIRDI
jgi:hypothetical protein